MHSVQEKGERPKTFPTMASSFPTIQNQKNLKKTKLFFWYCIFILISEILFYVYKATFYSPYISCRKDVIEKYNFFTGFKSNEFGIGVIMKKKLYLLVGINVETAVYKNNIWIWFGVSILRN